MISRIFENRYLISPLILAALCGFAGCERPDTSTNEGIDRQTCLGSELTPIEALAACSRFITATNKTTLNRSDAYYGRGIAFADLGEWHHAKLDLEHALELDPRNQWARQRLENVNQVLSKSGG